MIDKYLRFKSGRVYWRFFDLQKAFDSVEIEALWFKTTRKEIRDKLVNCIKNVLWY
jgi:hypothetical protein